MIPFGLCSTAGYYLVRGRPRGFTLGYVSQALQIPIVLIPAFGWKFIAGAIASLAVTIDGLHLYAGLEATWIVGPGNWGSLPATLGINIAPILVIVLLRKAQRAVA